MEYGIYTLYKKCVSASVFSDIPWPEDNLSIAVVGEKKFRFCAAPFPSGLPGLSQLLNAH